LNITKDNLTKKILGVKQNSSINSYFYTSVSISSILDWLSLTEHGTLHSFEIISTVYWKANTSDYTIKNHKTEIGGRGMDEKEDHAKDKVKWVWSPKQYQRGNVLILFSFPTFSLFFSVPTSFIWSTSVLFCSSHVCTFRHVF
jgi:hypothetical protein